MTVRQLRQALFAIQDQDRPIDAAEVLALDRFRVAPMTFPDYDLAQRLLDASGARVVTTDRCYCLVCPDPSRDFIAMTRLDPVWGDADRWWSALFHELTHWVAEGFDRVRWRGEVCQADCTSRF